MEEDAACTNGQVSDLGVAGLTKGDADFFLGGFEEGVGVVIPEEVEIWSGGVEDGIALQSRIAAKAVKDNKDGGGDGHG